MNLLFIGNSHTYYNDMPATVGELLIATGEKCHVTMLAHGGKSLQHHAIDPAVLFNIRHGKYDAIIAQENVAHFRRDTFFAGANSIRELAERAGARLFLYMPPLPQENEKALAAMSEAYLEYKEQYGVGIAPVGEAFARLGAHSACPALFRADGVHATPFGSFLMALTIFYAVTERKRVLSADKFSSTNAPLEVCQLAHTEACRAARLYNG